MEIQLNNCVICEKNGYNVKTEFGFPRHYKCCVCPECGCDDILWKRNSPPWAFVCLDCQKYWIWIPEKGVWL